MTSLKRFSPWLDLSSARVQESLMKSSRSPRGASGSLLGYKSSAEFASGFRRSVRTVEEGAFRKTLGLEGLQEREELGLSEKQIERIEGYKAALRCAIYISAPIGCLGLKA